MSAVQLCCVRSGRVEAAGYIDARPPTASSTKTLATHGCRVRFYLGSAQARPESNRPCNGSFVLALAGAPLSGGFDIARKPLGQLEIATVQTTTIYQIAGLVNLTTFLRTRPGDDRVGLAGLRDYRYSHPTQTQSDRYSYCGDHGLCLPLWGSQHGFEGVTH